MTRTSFSVTTDYQTLNEITNRLNGASSHPAGSLRGMFFRREDFESSAKQLMEQLSKERILALVFAEKGYGGDDFAKEAEKSGVKMHMRSRGSTGDSSFDTYGLSPALRHFINDYCRILEPLVKLLAQKHTNISARNRRRPSELISLNTYLKILNEESIVMPFDQDHFIKLYEEIWNDYKHAESSGVQASGWLSDGRSIKSEPKLYSSELVYFKDMHVEVFIKRSLDNMNILLNYVA